MTFFSLRKVNLHETLKQIFQIGYFSLPIVSLTALFTGAVLAIQSYMGFTPATTSEEIIAKIVVISITREIGPVLVGIIVSGRIASSIAAELGSMKVTEQIDVLRSLSVNFYSYLVLPRVLSGIIFFPIIAIAADVLGVFGGYIISVYKFNFNNDLYIQNTLNFLNIRDVLTGVIKSTVFGFIATTVSCYNGIMCRGGARGVGFAVTQSVVTSFILILFSNYLITLIMFYGE
jgi:phospholipid/cholesterol/gamma-HCH transport system permease protein